MTATKDKITNIVPRDEGGLHGISENGNLYVLRKYANCWQFICDSPELCPQCGDPLNIEEQGKVAVCRGCGYTEA